MQGVNVRGHGAADTLGKNEFRNVVGPVVLVVVVLGLLWAGMSFFVDDLLNSLPLHEIEVVQR